MIFIFPCLAIGGDDCDKLLEPLGMEVEKTLQEPTSHDSVCQREDSEEHSSTPSETSMTKTEVMEIHNLHGAPNLQYRKCYMLDFMILANSVYSDCFDAQSQY